MRRLALCTAAICTLALPAVCARGDLVRLRSGGEVRGKLDAGYSKAPHVTITTLTGGTVVIDRAEIVFTTVRSLETEEYETRAASVPNTVEARRELADWCSRNRLRTQRDEQLEQILLIDPEDEAAHKALGHVEEHGEWMTRDEQMAHRGYVRHKGRYYTQHELELIQKTDVQRAAEQEWFAQVHAWVRWVAGRNERQKFEGIEKLQQIVDPAAVAALTTNMAEHEDPGVRRLFVSVLAKIPGPVPVSPLVSRSLYDGVPAVRADALAALKPDQYTAAMELYLPALLNNDNAVVNRAADALGTIGDPRTVPALIDALVTNHNFKVSVPVNDAIGVGVSAGGVGFADPRAVSQYLPPDIEAQLRTGQLPFGAVVLPPAGIPQKTKLVKVQAQLTNDQVLLALSKITGQNFGFDERTWKLWWASQANAGGELTPTT